VLESLETRTSYKSVGDVVIDLFFWYSPSHLHWACVPLEPHKPKADVDNNYVCCSITDPFYKMYLAPKLSTLTSFAYGITLLKYIHQSGIMVQHRYFWYMWLLANPGWRPAANRSGLLSFVSHDTIERMLFNVNERRNARADNHAPYTDEVCLPRDSEPKNAVQCIPLVQV